MAGERESRVPLEARHGIPAVAQSDDLTVGHGSPQCSLVCRRRSARVRANPPTGPGCWRHRTRIQHGGRTADDVVIHRGRPGGKGRLARLLGARPIARSGCLPPGRDAIPFPVAGWGPCCGAAGRSPSEHLCAGPNPGPMTLDGTNTWVLLGPGATEAVVIDPGPSTTTTSSGYAAWSPTAAHGSPTPSSRMATMTMPRPPPVRRADRIARPRGRSGS